MARGAASKEIITSKIMEVFPNSFVFDKEIRIPIEEDGEIVQIKVKLTAAKTNVEIGEDVAMPAGTPISAPSTATTFNPLESEITPEEKAETKNLLESLGF